jgi:ABC-type sugar transport system ATPase subunit
LYILDEPTTGCISRTSLSCCIVVLQRLRDEGNTIIVIEHNLDVIKTADWVVDLGPEGRRRRRHARRIIAVGTPGTSGALRGYSPPTRPPTPASRALVVSVMGSQPRVAAMDLSIALCLGLAPAAFLGIPGLVGLAAAIATRLILTAFVLPQLPADPRARTGITQQFTEIGLYLGALAAWRYI